LGQILKNVDEQALKQIYGTLVSLGMGIVFGVITGFILKFLYGFNQN
jgi:hypothetical protein